MHVSWWFFNEVCQENEIFVCNFACDSDVSSDTYISLKPQNRDFYFNPTAGFLWVLIIGAVNIIGVLSDLIYTVFKVIVIHTNCTERSFHEAVKGHIISCSYGVFPLCRCGKRRVRNLSTLSMWHLCSQLSNTGN